MKNLYPNLYLKKVEDIAFCNLTSEDVVRHPLVQRIVKAYEEYEKVNTKAKDNRKNDRRRDG